MIKIKNLQYRSLWYKKNFYYLKAGQSLSLATKISANCQETMQIHQEIDNGLKLSDLLQDETLKNHFSKTEISFIKVAENTGNVQNVFLTLSQLLKDQYMQRQKMINAFIYPLLVLCITSLLLFMILFFIIPKITPLFEDLDNLPFTTKAIMFLSKHLLSLWYLDLSLFLFVSIIFIYFKENVFIINIKSKIRDFCLNEIIYIKDIYLYWHIEKWLKVVYMSLNSGVTISESLKFAYESINDSYLKKQFNQIYLHINNGSTVSLGLKLLDKKIYLRLKDWESIIDSGEKTGKYSEVFEICHLNIKENLDNLFDRFQKMIEPLLIIFVGLIVMIICISIILPMYQLTQSIQ